MASTTICGRSSPSDGRPRGGVAPDDLVTPKSRSRAVDAVDPGHVRAARLQRVAEQHPDRPLAEHGDLPADDVAQPVERVQDGAQRLDHGGVGRAQLVVELDDAVDAREEALRQPAVAVGPADDPRARIGRCRRPRGTGNPAHRASRRTGWAARGTTAGPSRRSRPRPAARARVPARPPAPAPRPARTGPAPSSHRPTWRHDYPQRTRANSMHEGPGADAGPSCPASDVDQTVWAIAHIPVRDAFEMSGPVAP